MKTQPNSPTVGKKLGYLFGGLVLLTVLVDLLEKRLTYGEGLGRNLDSIDAVFVRLLWAGTGIAVYQLIMPVVNFIRERRNASSL